MTEHPFTPREAAALIAAVEKLTIAIENMRGEMASTYVRKDVYVVERDETRAKVASHSSMFQWAGRLVGSVLIVALLATIIVQNGMPG